MLLLDLPDDIIFHILSFAKYDNEPHIIYVEKNDIIKYCKIFYKGDWSDNKFNGYGTMYCQDSDYCNVKLLESYNITVLNTFYKFFVDK